MRMPIIRRALATVLAAAAFPALAAAGAAPEEAAARLYERGYSDVEIQADNTPGYRAMACKDGTRFAVEMGDDGNIVRTDPRGPCNAVAEGGSSKGPPPGWDGAGPREREQARLHASFADELYRRGYADIRVTDRDDDEIELLACRDGRLYEIEIEHGRIDDIDDEGRCGPHGRADVDVHAPGAGVHVDDDRVDVEAPFTGVHVGRDGVHVRAPFVDLHVD